MPKGSPRGRDVKDTGMSNWGRGLAAVAVCAACFMFVTQPGQQIPASGTFGTTSSASAATPLPKPDFLQTINELLVQIQANDLQLAAQLIKHCRPEWKQTAEISSLACFVEHERGRMKKARKMCRRALHAPFKSQTCTWKHLAFNQVSNVFEKMGEPDAAINAARMAMTNAGTDGSFHVRLVQLLWRRGACADMAEVVSVLRAAITFKNPDYSQLLTETLRIAQQTSLSMCSFLNLPVYVQHLIHHPELAGMINEKNANPHDVTALQFRQYLHLYRSGRFAPKEDGSQRSRHSGKGKASYSDGQAQSQTMPPHQKLTDVGKLLPASPLLHSFNNNATSVNPILKPPMPAVLAVHHRLHGYSRLPPP